MKQIINNILDALVKDGFIVIDEALDANLAKELLNFAREQNNYKQAGISSALDTHIDKTRRSDKILWLNEDNSVQSKFLDFTSRLQKSINQELYMGLSYYESHFAIYNEGDYYEKHLDSFKNSKNRVVTTVYYLNEQWNQSDGGELVIYDKNDNVLSKVLPKQNTLIIFLSDKFPHEVLATNKTRYSIAGWFRVDKF
jgi:SM-20-related protein